MLTHLSRATWPAICPSTPEDRSEEAAPSLPTLGWQGFLSCGREAPPLDGWRTPPPGEGLKTFLISAQTDPLPVIYKGLRRGANRLFAGSHHGLLLYTSGLRVTCPEPCWCFCLALPRAFGFARFGCSGSQWTLKPTTPVAVRPGWDSGSTSARG